MLMDIATEPVCPAVIEAAAIAEAEWMRLRPPGGPVGHMACELPAPGAGALASVAGVMRRPPLEPLAKGGDTDSE